jgi:D-lyxose ketol-isomerase
MKRSEINGLIRHAIEFFQDHQFYLPPWAYWRPEDWRGKKATCSEIMDNQLGWDITDFGKGEFDKYGLLLFTIRNGNSREIETKPPTGSDPRVFWDNFHKTWKLREQGKSIGYCRKNVHEWHALVSSGIYDLVMMCQRLKEAPPSPSLEELERIGWTPTSNKKEKWAEFSRSCPISIYDIQAKYKKLVSARVNARRPAVNPKVYAEKIMIVRENQETPWHFHWKKMEDIINRGGGNLVIELYNAKLNDDSEFSEESVPVKVDGVLREIAPGGAVILSPGESICLEQRMYHRFFAEEGKGIVLVGEVSQVNDDMTDNRFYKPQGRFPSIVEDEAPLHLLVGDYERFLS